MKEYKYLNLVEINSPTKTKVFDVLNKVFNTYLGQIKWYAPWRKYCYFPSDGLVFDEGCLADINDFINKLMFEWKNK